MTKKRQLEMLESLSIRNFNPMNDFIFKFIFGKEEHKAITIDFLNAVLRESLGHEILDLTFAPTEMVPDAVGDKLIRLDIACTLDTGEIIDVEVQIINYHDMERRTLYYWSQMYSSSLTPGAAYQDLRSCITINIMRFNLFPGDAPHAMYSIYDSKSGRRLNRDLELHFIEIPKYRRLPQKPFRQMTKLERWLAYFANRLKIEEKEEIQMSEPAIAHAFDAADYFLLSKEEKMKYINREIAIHDYNSMQRALHDQSIEAHTKGLEEGRRKGLQQGMQQGQEEGIASMVRSMLANHLSVPTVAKVAGWTTEQVEAFGKKAELL